MVEIGDSDRLDDPNLQLYLCRWKHGWWGRWCLKRAAWNGSKLRLVEDRASDEVDEAVNASPKYGKHGGFVLFSELWRCKFALPGALGSFWEPNGSNMPWLVWKHGCQSYSYPWPSGWSSGLLRALGPDQGWDVTNGHHRLEEPSIHILGFLMFLFPLVASVQVSTMLDEL
jgi:hypothetical protein